MTDYSGIAQRLLRAADNAASERTTEEDAFVSLVSATRRNFRRPDQASPRGRRKKDTFSRKVLLAKLAHIDFLPGSTEQKYLKNRGLGEPKESVVIYRSSTIDIIKDNILSLYSNHIQSLLRMSGFRLARCDRSKKIYFLENINNAEELEKELGSSKIIVVPNNDFPNDLPTLNENSSESNLAAATTTTRTTSRTQNAVPRSSVPMVPQASTSGANNTAQEGTNDYVLLEHFNFEDIPDVLQIERTEYPNAEEDTSESDANIDYPTIESNEIEILNINRDNVLEELLSIYQDTNLALKNLQVHFNNESGADAGGLTKEMFSLFWISAEERYFAGEQSIVPFLPLHRQRKEKSNFLSIGRILDHCIYLTGSLPSKINKVTYLKLGNPDFIISDDILLHEFLLYITLRERQLINKALWNFPNLNHAERENLAMFYSSYNLFELPKENEVKEQIITIAREVLIEKPNNLINEMRMGIPLTHFETFWKNLTIKKINKALVKALPTPEKVVNCIITSEDLKNEEERVLYFLKTYIYSLDQDELKQFLFFVTGSCEMPNIITLNFLSLTGLNMRPIAHTCSNVLELSVCYDTYQEFKRNMSTHLNSEYSYHYSQL